MFAWPAYDINETSIITTNQLCKFLQILKYFVIQPPKLFLHIVLNLWAPDTISPESNSFVQKIYQKIVVLSENKRQHIITGLGIGSSAILNARKKSVFFLYFHILVFVDL